MKIFYYCSMGTYSSIVAANYHLGEIKGSKIKSRDIIKLPHFDSLMRDEIGCPIFIGIDKMGNEIYTYGVKEEKVLLTHAVIDWLEAFGIPKSEYKLIDLTMANNNFFLRVGIYLSNILGIKNLGGFMGAYGISRMFHKIVETVDKVKGELT